MRFEPITISDGCYRQNGKPFFLYSGEFHYFRVPKRDWRRRMRLFRAAGGNCLATYVPWLIHEPKEGHFVFGGARNDGSHDIEGFLETAAEEGLYVIVRPGPYQYSELKYDGLPAWLCEGYPQLHAHNWKGEVFRTSSISYLHPLFLDKVRRWFDQVCPRLAAHTISRGGSVAFAQIDNELAGIHTWFGSLDCNAQTMGFGRPDGRYPAFLRQRYGNVENMNAAYGTSWKSFEDARPIEPGGGVSPSELRRKRDYFHFYLETVAEYGATLAAMMRERAIDVPIVHNSAGPTMNAWFLELAKTVPPPFVLGSDHYYTLGQDWPQNNPTPQYAVRIFLSLEMLRLMGFPPTVYELPGGSLSDWPPITPEDARACYLANVALGMKGSNFYIFTGGPNVPGTGTTSEIYDYGASVGANGEIRPLYRAQKEVGLFLRRNAWLAGATRLHDLRIGISFEQARADAYWHGRGNFLLSDPEAWTFLRTGVATTAFCAGLSPMCVDLSDDGWTADTSTPLVVVTSSVMPAQLQERLARFVRQGGALLLTPVIPQFDVNFQPCTALSDVLGAVSTRHSAAYPALAIAGVRNVYSNGDVFAAEKLPPDARPLGRDEATGAIIAWRRKIGRGSAVVLGLRWSHAMREHEKMFVNVLKTIGLKPVLRVSNPNVWAALWTDGRKSAMFLMNLLSAGMSCSASAALRKGSRTWKMKDRRLPPMSVIPVVR